MIKVIWKQVWLLFCVLAACTSIKKDHILRVGISPDYPPFAFKLDNQLAGTDVEMVQKIAHKLGKKVEFKEMDFNALIPSLCADRVDVVISGVSPTPERAKKVLFSKPYHVEKNCLMFNTKYNKFASPADIKDKKIAATLGTTQQKVVERYCSHCKFYNNNFQIVEELKIGRVDGWIVGEAQGIEFVQKYPNLKYFLLPKTYNLESSFAIALRRSDTKLANDIDKVIEQGV